MSIETRGALDPAEVAAYLGLSRSKVYELMRLDPADGGLPSWHAGKSRRVSVESLRAWMRDREAAETSEAA